jgi:hypothetical protein
VAAGGAADAGEPVTEQPAVEISTQLALDEGRISLSGPASVFEEGLQILPDDRVEHGHLGPASAIGAGEWGGCGSGRTLEGSGR